VLAGLLDTERLVTLTGPGGVGKTSLALAAARGRPRPPHGSWLVELATLQRGEEVVGAVAATLGLIAGGLEATVDDVGGLVGALADRQLLLVLDNAEHVVEQVAVLLEQLLAHAAGIVVLATSREALGVAEEQVLPVAPLATPGPDDAVDELAGTPAVQLLVDRARRHDPWFVLDASTTPMAAALVRHLDGIPLAVELAAAQLRARTLAELVADLEDHATSFTSPRRGATTRQRSLQGAFDWSWELLDDDHRRAWSALAVPPGGFDLDLADALLGGAGVVTAARTVVGELVDRSLVTVDTTGASARYGMLTTVRSYARERLADLDLDAVVHAAHADAVERALRAATVRRDPARFGVDLDALALWLDDARTALTWADRAGDRARMQRLAGLLGWGWLLGGRGPEGVRWLDRALGPVDDVDPVVTDRTALLWASGLRVDGTHTDGARWSALALEAPLQDADRAVARVFAAVHAAQVGGVEATAAQLASAQQAAEPLGGWPLGFCHLTTAQLGRLTGRFEAVREHAVAARGLLTEPAVGWARAYAIDILIDTIHDDGGDRQADERAEALAREGLALTAGRGLPELEARLRLQLGRSLHDLGRVEEARRQLDEAVRLAASGPHGVGYGFALLVAGSLARRRGELGVARAQLAEAAPLLAPAATPYGATEVAVEQALTAVALGDLDGAADHVAVAEEMAASLGEPSTSARVAEARAALAAARDRTVTGT
jgi:predicted ATPase